MDDWSGPCSLLLVHQAELPGDSRSNTVCLFFVGDDLASFHRSPSELEKLSKNSVACSLLVLQLLNLFS